MKKLLAVLFLSLFLISFASADKPITAITFSEGYNIKIPIDNIIQVGEDYEFEIHVYNISNGMPVTSGIGCYAHLYDYTGHHIYEGYDETVSHNFDYSFPVMGENFSTSDVYYFIAQCNGSKLGGYNGEIVYVTQTGREIFPNTLIFFMLLSVIVFLGLLWSLYKILEDLTAVEVTFNTVFIGFSAYIINLSYYYYLTNFMPMGLMLDISLLGISAFGLTHLFVPLIGLVFTWIKKGRAE